MNWIAFAVVAYLLLGVELGAASGLALGASGITPSFVLPLLVFCALGAAPTHALWAGFALGLALDLLTPRPLAGDPGVARLLGPQALGYVAAAYLVLTMRGLMMRRNPLTLVFLTVVAGLLARLVSSTLLTVHAALHADIGWSAGRELLVGVASVLYSAGAAAVLAWPLQKIAFLFAFPDPMHRRGTRRSF